jgi:hypothetical protein
MKELEWKGLENQRLTPLEPKAEPVHSKSWGITFIPWRPRALPSVAVEKKIPPATVKEV